MTTPNLDDGFGETAARATQLVVEEVEAVLAVDAEDDQRVEAARLRAVPLPRRPLVGLGCEHESSEALGQHRAGDGRPGTGGLAGARCSEHLRALEAVADGPSVVPGEAEQRPGRIERGQDGGPAAMEETGHEKTPLARGAWPRRCPYGDAFAHGGRVLGVRSGSTGQLLMRR